jgi:hypothetical protein
VHEGLPGINPGLPSVSRGSRDGAYRSRSRSRSRSRLGEVTGPRGCRLKVFIDAWQRIT